jgi:predicted membrane-bound spermidine synthase
MRIPGSRTYIGIFLLSLAVMVFELTLTRIFSVTLFYHLAFFVISVMMLGTAIGAMLVYCFPKKFPEGEEDFLLAKYCLLFAGAAPIAILTHALIPMDQSQHLIVVVSVLITCLLVSGALIFAGICVCLVLTRYPLRTDRLYAADLAGASLGCLVFAFSLGPLDGVSETVFASAIAAIAAAFFAGTNLRFGKIATGLAALLLCFAVGNSYLVNYKNSGLRILWTHGKSTSDSIFERWSLLARITVTGNPPNSVYSTVGYSTVGPKVIGQGYDFDLDGSARTSMIGHPAGSPPADFLKFDLSYIGHYIRPDARVLIIGAGGGRDVLAALAFNQKFVRGLELNPNIFQLVTQRWGDFAGHLDKLPNVSLVNDEARSYITRSPEKYDIIQMSLIDTWAATANGAYVLTENCLYTSDAWKQFLSRLNPHGFFSVTRWYTGDPPIETMRTLSLAAATLRQMGVTDPENNIIVVRNGVPGKTACATFLVSPQPFSKEDVNRILEQCKRLKFDCLLAPGVTSQQNLLDVVKGNMGQWKDSIYNLAAPSDDSPFFFNMIKLQKVFDSGGGEYSGLDANSQAVYIILDALIISTLGSLLLAWLPLRIVKPGTPKAFSLVAAGYFISIGLGFMFIEISQIQRFIVFLGHPTYGLTVVLLTLLLSSGMGSLSVSYLPKTTRAGVVLLSLTVLSLTISAIALPYLFETFRYAPTLERIAIASAALLVPGFCMGFGFPIGMRMSQEKSPTLTTWLWGLNGAGSVIGSVLALCVSLGYGLRALSWVAVGTYAFALLCYMVASRIKTTVD